GPAQQHQQQPRPTVGNPERPEFLALPDRRVRTELRPEATVEAVARLPDLAHVEGRVRARRFEEHGAAEQEAAPPNGRVWVLAWATRCREEGAERGGSAREVAPSQGNERRHAVDAGFGVVERNPAHFRLRHPERLT